MTDKNDETRINHFKARFGILLRKRGWSLTELSRHMGRSQPNIRYIVEKGNPKMSTLKEFADAFDVTSEELLEEVTVEEYGEAMLPTFAE